MHCLEILHRINSEWPTPLSRYDRREQAIQHLEKRLGLAVDRNDPMLGAIAGIEMALMAMFDKREQ